MSAPVSAAHSAWPGRAASKQIARATFQPSIARTAGLLPATKRSCSGPCRCVLKLVSMEPVGVHGEGGKPRRAVRVFERGPDHGGYAGAPADFPDAVQPPVS